METTFGSMNDARAEHVYHPVEIPPGKPQIEYCPESDQWVPRGHVLRCVVHDWDREARVVIDGREPTQAEFGRMLTITRNCTREILRTSSRTGEPQSREVTCDPDRPLCASLGQGRNVEWPERSEDIGY